MAEDDGQEKTLDPTPQKLERARKEGDVPKSGDLATFASYLGLLVALAIAGGSIAFGAAAPLISFLGAPSLMVEHILGPGGPKVALDILGTTMLALLPLFLAPAIGVIVALTVQRAWVFAPGKLAPKLSRISPISNAAQKFGPTGLVEFLKSVVKLTLIAVALIWIFLSDHDGIAMWVALDGRVLASLLFQEGMIMLGAATGIVGLIASLDVLWQQYDHWRRQRMSQQELKDEMKSTEGDPHMKGKRREKGRKIAMSQMLKNVPQADVVIVNPTHYAVALKWDRKPGSAPECVAKGVDAIALKIREIAAENHVPIHSDPPTARALHAILEPGDEVRPEHYEAVAVAIRFADAMRKRARAAGGWR